MDLIEQVRAGRRVNTPLFAIETQDQPACQSAIAKMLDDVRDDKGNPVNPVFVWDAVRGLRPTNGPAVDWAVQFLGVKDSKQEERDAALRTLSANTGAPIAALDFAQNLPERAALLMTNLAKWIADPVVATGILNLRETFKRNKRTLLGTSDSWSLPGDLASSMVLIDEPLPTADARGAILDKLYAGAKKDFPKLGDEAKVEAMTAGSGLSSFMVEQTYAMSLSKEAGLSLSNVWERKRTAFNQIDGVTLEEENGPTFADIRGLAQILKRERAHFGGKNASAVVVRIEEIEKAFAGTGGDSSGTAQAGLGYILDFMQENRCTGFIAVGPGGSGKSLVSKALGREFRKPVVAFDVKATEDKFVGESGVKMRNALKAIKGLADGRPILFVATCNKLDSLPPELRRRFKQGIWFFDLPSREEKDAIWSLYATKFGLSIKPGDLPNDGVWTGAEIFNCAETAANEGITLKEAAEFIVPVAEADPVALRKLRAMAHERFLNASAPGSYVNPDAKPRAEAESTGERALDLTE